MGKGLSIIFRIFARVQRVRWGGGWNSHLRFLKILILVVVPHRNVTQFSRVWWLKSVKWWKLRCIASAWLIQELALLPSSVHKAVCILCKRFIFFERWRSEFWQVRGLAVDISTTDHTSYHISIFIVHFWRGYAKRVLSVRLWKCWKLWMTAKSNNDNVQWKHSHIVSKHYYYNVK